MVRWEGSRRPLPVHQQTLWLAVDHVLLLLCDVVRNIVDHVHVKVVWGALERLCECLPHKKGHHGPVDPCVICSSGHAGEVVLPLLGIDSRTRQLPVIDLDAVAAHGGIHGREGVGRDLVPQTSAALRKRDEVSTTQRKCQRAMIKKNAIILTHVVILQCFYVRQNGRAASPAAANGVDSA